MPGSSLKLSNRVLSDMNMGIPFSSNPRRQDFERTIKSNPDTTIRFSINTLVYLYSVNSSCNPIVMKDSRGFDRLVSEEVFKDILKFMSTQKLNKEVYSTEQFVVYINKLIEKLEDYLKEGLEYDKEILIECDFNE